MNLEKVKKFCENAEITENWISADEKVCKIAYSNDYQKIEFHCVVDKGYFSKEDDEFLDWCMANAYKVWTDEKVFHLLGAYQSTKNIAESYFTDADSFVLFMESGDGVQTKVSISNNPLTFIKSIHQANKDICMKYLKQAGSSGLFALSVALGGEE